MERGARVALVFVSLVFLLYLLWGCQALRPQSPNEPPVAAFEVSAEEVYPGETILLDASASFDPDRTIVASARNFRDGKVAEGVTVRHAFWISGAYNVTFIVKDEVGNRVEPKTLI